MEAISARQDLILVTMRPIRRFGRPAAARQSSLERPATICYMRALSGTAGPRSPLSGIGCFAVVAELVDAQR
jgi:hypothetical protein